MLEGSLGAAQPLFEWTDLSQDSGLFNATRKVSGDPLDFLVSFPSVCVTGFLIHGSAIDVAAECKASKLYFGQKPPKSFATRWGQTDKRNKMTGSARAQPTVLELVLKSDSRTWTDLAFCTLYSGVVSCMCVVHPHGPMLVHTHTCVISAHEPSSVAATGVPEWWQLIMKNQIWGVPFLSSCRSLAFPRNPPVAFCDPEKEVSIWKQLFPREWDDILMSVLWAVEEIQG